MLKVCWIFVRFFFFFLELTLFCSFFLAGELTHKGKVGLVEDAFDDVKTSRAGSRAASRIGTPRAGTPVVSVPGTGDNSAATSAAPSDAEGVPSVPRIKKKKVNQDLDFDGNSADMPLLPNSQREMI